MLSQEIQPCANRQASSNRYKHGKQNGIAVRSITVIIVDPIGKEEGEKTAAIGIRRNSSQKGCNNFEKNIFPDIPHNGSGYFVTGKKLAEGDGGIDF